MKKYNGKPLKKSSVIFNEEKHEYWLGEKQLFGITSLINDYLYNGEKYKGVPKHIMDRARAVGSLVHKEIEEYYTKGICGFTAELPNFITQQQAKFKVIENEFTVDNGKNATKIDLVLWWESDLILCDIKTTATLDIDYLSCQLSINAEMFESQTGIKVDKLMAYWTREDRFIEIPRLSAEKVQKVLNGEIQTKTNEVLELIQTDKQTAFVQLQRQIQSQKAMLEQLEQQQDQMRNEIMEAMKQNNIKSYDMGEIKITYIAPTTRESLDGKTLKAELPEIYEKYKKETQVKEQLKITIRSEK